MHDLKRTLFTNKTLLKVDNFMKFWEDEISEMPEEEVVDALCYHLKDDEGLVLQVMAPYI
jgi:hypothetical protein